MHPVPRIAEGERPPPWPLPIGGQARIAEATRAIETKSAADVKRQDDPIAAFDVTDGVTEDDARFHRRAAFVHVQIAAANCCSR